MQKQKKEIQSLIEKAAIREFSGKGYKQASIRSIAKESGVSKSNLYNYFESKKALYDSLCDSLYLKLQGLLEHFKENERNESFSNESFIEQFIKVLTMRIGEFMQSDRDRLLMILNSGPGTKYEQLKTEIISFLENHFIDDLSENGRKRIKNPFVMHLISTNIVESILEIVRHYKDAGWAKTAIENYLNYHIKGIAQFFR